MVKVHAPKRDHRPARAHLIDRRSKIASRKGAVTCVKIKRKALLRIGCLSVSSVRGPDGNVE